jgi:AraC family transcriptional activator of pobA
MKAVVKQFMSLEIRKHKCLADHAIVKSVKINDGVPTVAFVAQQLNVSPHYLSGLLRSVTGLNTQQHIHTKLINKAKELLSTTSLTVSEIAYSLRFEQIQSFSKLFKTKTNLSPVDFRQSFK